MKSRHQLLWALSLLIVSSINAQNNNMASSESPYLVVLGTLQDGGSPHPGCEKECCKTSNPSKKVVSLGLLDPGSGKRFLVEASPDITSQLKSLNQAYPGKNSIA
ncbi:MAG: hypothetical protein RLZZ42_203, partial [Bacteroidota bacterium]